MYKNKIGLEFEFLVRKNNELVFPSDYGYLTDEFIILGEERCDPGENLSEVLSNFYKKWFELHEKSKNTGVVIDIKKGYEVISPDFYSKIMKRMGTKEINQSRNIYNTDILKLSDAIVENGVSKGHKISIGLHIHFSSIEENKKELEYDQYIYTPFSVNFSLGEIPIKIDGYKKSDNPNKTKLEVTSTANRITTPVLRYFIKELDNKLLKKYNITDEILKYRMPGFY